MVARIYRPSRSATQSGQARTRLWVLDYAPATAREVEPLMGWTSTSDPNAQLRLNFATQAEAVAYAERNGLSYVVEPPKPVTRKQLSYSDNFKATRLGQWTH
jgi:hypothetical protein